MNWKQFVQFLQQQKRERYGRIQNKLQKFRNDPEEKELLRETIKEQKWKLLFIAFIILTIIIKHL